MRWTLFAKLFYVGYLGVKLDDRIPELGTCFMLTSLSMFVMARTCQRMIDERERLKPCGFADAYLMLYVDVLYQWSAVFGPKPDSSSQTGSDSTQVADSGEKQACSAKDKKD